MTRAITILRQGYGSAGEKEHGRAALFPAKSALIFTEI
jgi:hypothetical protein